MVPETTWGRLFCIVYALFGIPLTALMLRSVGNRITEWIIAMIKQFDRRVYNRETENAELKSAVIAFCLLWFIILLPALVISKLEPNWDYMGSVYYCFITFSTIGFGDLVPTSLRADNEVETQVGYFNQPCPHTPRAICRGGANQALTEGQGIFKRLP